MSFLVPDTPAPPPPPPSRDSADVSASAAARTQELQRSLSQGRESTILGGRLDTSVGGQSLLTKKRLGE